MSDLESNQSPQNLGGALGDQQSGSKKQLQGEELLLTLSKSVQALTEKAEMWDKMSHAINLTETGKRKRDEAENPGCSKAQKTSKPAQSIDVDDFLDNGTREAGNSHVEDDIDSDLLQDLGDFFNTQAVTGPAVSVALGKVTSQALRAPTQSDKMQELMDRNRRPDNIENLQVPSVDNSIWRQLKRETRVADVYLQKSTAQLSACLVPIIKVLDLLKEKKESQDVKPHVSDAFKMICHFINQNTEKRKEKIKKEVLPQFKSICDSSSSATQLFGDNFKDEVKALNDKSTQLTTSAIQHVQQQKSRTFLYQGRGQNFFRKHQNGPWYRQNFNKRSNFTDNKYRKKNQNNYNKWKRQANNNN